MSTRKKAIFGFLHISIAVLLTQVIVWVISPQITQSSEIAGFPLWMNYNINQLFFRAYAWMVIPAFIFLLLNRRYVAFVPNSVGARAHSVLESVTPVLIGLCYGFLAYGLNDKWFWTAFVGFSSTSIIVAIIFPRLKGWVMVFTLLSLLSLSSATRMSLEGSVKHYPWFPVWVGAMTVLGALATRHYLKKRYRDWEWRFFLSVVCPILIFLIHSSFPSHLPNIRSDFHHPGEVLVPAKWILRGLFPWRDITMHQGLLAEPLKAWVGMFLFEPTWWGAEAGEKLILIPIGLMLSYFLRARMFSRQSGFLLFSTFVLPFLVFPLFGRRVCYYERLLLYPVYLAILLRAFEAQKRSWFALAGALMALMNFLTPETLLLSVASLIVLAFRARSLGWQEFKRGLVSWGSGFVAVASIILVWLWHYEAITSFIDYYRYFLCGYRFIYGMPLKGNGIRWFSILIAIPGLIFFIAINWPFFLRRKLGEVEWMLSVVAVFAVLYYQKFLNEADDHIYAVIFCTLPFLEYLLSKAWVMLSRYRNILVVMGIVAAGVFIFNNQTPIEKQMDKVRGKYSTDGRGGYRVEGAGLLLATNQERKIISDFKRLFDAVLEPSDPIFDLTNSSHLFHFLLGRPFIGRFFQSITLVSPRGQRDATQSIERVRPKIIVFDRNFGFDVSYPVPINVRFYQLSAAIMRDYAPWVQLNGYVLVRRKDWQPANLPASQFTGIIKYQELSRNACAWGAIPHAWAGSSPSDVDYLEITFDRGVKDHWVLTDHEAGQGDSANAITFDSFDGQAMTYRIPVGSCLQWSVWKRKPVYLHHSVPQSVREVRVVTREGQASRELRLMPPLLACRSTNVLINNFGIFNLVPQTSRESLRKIPHSIGRREIAYPAR